MTAAEWGILAGCFAGAVGACCQHTRSSLHAERERSDAVYAPLAAMARVEEQIRALVCRLEELIARLDRD